jgi:hypothetical protein
MLQEKRKMQAEKVFLAEGSAGKTKIAFLATLLT